MVFAFFIDNGVDEFLVNQGINLFKRILSNTTLNFLNILAYLWNSVVWSIWNVVHLSLFSHLAFNNLLHFNRFKTHSTLCLNPTKSHQMVFNFNIWVLAFNLEFLRVWAVIRSVKNVAHYIGWSDILLRYHVGWWGLKLLWRETIVSMFNHFLKELNWPLWHFHWSVVVGWRVHKGWFVILYERLRIASNILDVWSL